MQCRVLTLYITRDAKTFNVYNYFRVLEQVGVEQDVYVLSAEPIPVENNIVVRVPQHLPVPVRVGLSVNAALRKLDLSPYTHIFKVDGDVVLPPDYLLRLLRTDCPVAGRGAALLISKRFFLEALKGKYPVSYCDDGYISALSVSRGFWPPEYKGRWKPVIPVVRQRLREYAYGREYYKWGHPLALLVLTAPVLAHPRSKGFRSVVYNLAGYISAMLGGEKRYEWWRSYAYFRTRHFLGQALALPKKLANRLKRPAFREIST